MTVNLATVPKYIVSHAVWNLLVFVHKITCFFSHKISPDEETVTIRIELFIIPWIAVLLLNGLFVVCLIKLVSV